MNVTQQVLFIAAIKFVKTHWEDTRARVERDINLPQMVTNVERVNLIYSDYKSDFLIWFPFEGETRDCFYPGLDFGPRLFITFPGLHE